MIGYTLTFIALLLIIPLALLFLLRPTASNASSANPKNPSNRTDAKPTREQLNNIDNEVSQPRP